ncbi:MAG: FG-GAP-like repeat-containing protein, partial [Flavisolibacter sp.]
FIEKDYLYINQGNGTFKDQLEDHVQKISMSSMSTDLGDINNDGYPEIFTTDMIPDDDYRLKTTGTFDNIDLYLSKQKAGLYHQFVRNCLQLNNRDGSFSEIANFSGVSATDWSWGALFFDADNDGLNDIYVCNGITKDVGDLDFLDFFSNDVYQKMLETGKREEIDEILKHIPVTPLANRVFKNKGNLQFTDVGKTWGFEKVGFSNSIAYADLDNDGDLDLVINNENAPASIYENHSRETNGNNFIALMLKARSPNNFAIGSQIKIYKDNQVFYREVSPARGFQSSVDYKQIIGLGKIDKIDSMIVTWPDRTVSKYEHLQINRLHILQQGDQQPLSSAIHHLPSFLSPVTDSFVRHTEDDYIDFYYERNLPELLSREGPHVAKGDVNGDGLEDVYIAGAKGQAGQLYLQTALGGFVKKDEEVFNRYSGFEDVAVVFFDADGDRDLDLFIGAGGNSSRPGSMELQHRLYKNDGAGNFSIDTKALPNNDMNISVAVAQDYDGDGDMDLFVGSRSVPYQYGVTPQSYLFQNDGQGHFKDVAPQSLARAGMITSAVWADVAGDKTKELIVTGEWMRTKVFSYNGKSFEELKHTGLENLSGWWQSVASSDVNGDGKQDLVIGNIGENFYLRPEIESPVRLWVGDLDGSGTAQQFLTSTVHH